MPQRKALVIGINDYAPVGPGGPDLRGCVNDARDMANTLVILGYPPANIRFLTDAAATTANILSGIDWLLRRAVNGDSLVFYYSGHGSRVADTSGDETIDHLDEIICPHDIDFAARRYVTDDQLGARFRTAPAGANLEVILDSCHSGTGTKEFETGQPGAVARFIEPPLDHQFYIDYLKESAKLRTVSLVTRDSVPSPPMRHVLWAACRSDQTSWETSIGGVVRGVFTYNFCKVLRRAAATLKRYEIDRLVTAAIRSGGFAQVPQLEATRPELDDKAFQVGLVAAA